MLPPLRDNLLAKQRTMDPAGPPAEPLTWHLHHHTLRDCLCVSYGCSICTKDERECLFFNPVLSHSQWYIPIRISDPRSNLVLFPFLPIPWLFPFLPASIPIQVEIFCQFIAALLLIVFWVAEILKVKDTALLSWWAMTVDCVTVRRSSRRS